MRQSRSRTIIILVGGFVLLGFILWVRPQYLANPQFLGGVIAYHNDVKRDLLGVPMEDLARFGAVSEEVVLRMATGVRTKLAAEIGIAITGIAGPGGGTPEKPVGLVWIAVAAREAKARRFQMIGDRAEIRERAAQAALEMVRRTFSKG